MKNENQNILEQTDAKFSLEELAAKRRNLVRLNRGLAFGAIVSLAFLVWGIKNWLSPTVGTSDTWMLPLALIFFAQITGLLIFSLQEFRKADRQISRAIRDHSIVGPH